MDNAANLIHTLLHQLSTMYARESDQIMLEQLGIGFSQFKILSVLQENPSVQQRHIAFLLGQTEASVSRQIKLLRQKNLLETKILPQNRREHLTTLTPQGQETIEAARLALQKFQTSSLQHLSAKQQAKLLEMLAQVPPSAPNI